MPDAPDDMVVTRDGTIWFTGPVYGIQTDCEGERQPSELLPAVYRFDPADGRLTLVADDLEGPNGLCVSPDERRLDVSDSGDQFAEAPRRHIRVFDVDPESRAQPLRAGRVFHSLNPGYADGFHCDAEGRVPAPRRLPPLPAMADVHADRMTFIVDDRTALIARLDRLPCALATERRSIDPQTLLLRDPDGNLLLLRQGAPASSTSVS